MTGIGDLWCFFSHSEKLTRLDDMTIMMSRSMTQATLAHLERVKSQNAFRTKILRPVSTPQSGVRTLPAILESHRTYR